MLKVSQWKQIIGLPSVAQRANEQASASLETRFIREMEMTGYRI